VKLRTHVHLVEALLYRPQDRAKLLEPFRLFGGDVNHGENVHADVADGGVDQLTHGGKAGRLGHDVL
jgi:hypothetical protein